MSLEEKDILKKLIRNDTLFNNIYVFSQKFDVIPDDKEHIGAFIEYQDIRELRQEFINELSDTIIDWVYSSEKFSEIKQKLINNGKTEAAASREIGRLAQEKFRCNYDENLLVQGQLGELLLFQFIQRCMKAIPLLRKMPITTSAKHERYGADAIHYKIEKGKHIIILGEAKTYTSKYSFNKAFKDAIDSIISTYNNLNKELRLYVHEDFLDKDMQVIAEEYLTNKLKPIELQLVSIITYNEISGLNIIDEDSIKEQIKNIIREKYEKFDKNKIDLEGNPILKRITYIVFPVWDLEKLAKDFQQLV